MRIVLLDLARSVAIVLLLIGHVAQAMESPLGEFFGIQGLYRVSLGGVAVTLFLVLSGMALGLQRRDKKIQYVRFLVKRGLRIYPVYYMSVIIGVMVYLIRSMGEQGLSFSEHLNISDFILIITGFYPYAGQWGGPFVATSWFIALIMSLYFLFPILMKWIKRHPHRMIMALFFISLGFRFILGRYHILGHRPLDWFPLCRVFEFGLGTYIAILINPATLHNMVRWPTGAPLFRFISDISFPLFLIHYPLLFIIDVFSRNNVPSLISIILYMGVSIILSWITLRIDNVIPRAVILGKVFGNAHPKTNVSG